MSFTTLKWHNFTLQYLQYCLHQAQRILIFVGRLFWNVLWNLVRMAWDGDLTNFKCDPQRKSTGKSPSMEKLDWSLVAIQEREKCLYFYCGNWISICNNFCPVLLLDQIFWGPVQNFLRWTKIFWICIKNAIQYWKVMPKSITFDLKKDRHLFFTLMTLWKWYIFCVKNGSDHLTVAISELLCMKNAGTQITMDFS